MRSPVLSMLLLSTLMVLAITHITANEFFLYWKYFWLDNATHFLGGVSIALFVLLLPAFIRRLPLRYTTLLPVLLSTLAIGLVWEIFEIYAGISLLEPDFVPDTVSDLIMDLLGGSMGYFIGNRLRTL